MSAEAGDKSRCMREHEGMAPVLHIAPRQSSATLHSKSWTTAIPEQIDAAKQLQKMINHPAVIFTVAAVVGFALLVHRKKRNPAARTSHLHPNDVLEAYFDAAADYVASVAGTNALSANKLLDLYGLYKQSTEGPCTTGKPLFDWKARTKWSAWNVLGDLPSTAARQLYVSVLTDAVPEWMQEAGIRDKQQKSVMGPVFSSLAGSDQDNDQPQDNTTLHGLASTGDLPGLTQLLRQGIDVNSKDPEGCSALHWAADRGHCNVVEALLAAGADVNVGDNDNSTPLHYAALCEHSEVFRRLLLAGADSSVQNNDGETALDIAPASFGNHH